MIKHIILLCSTISIIIGYIYEESGGLIVFINENGMKIYAKDYYLSSGSDDSFIMGTAFMSFILSFTFAILSYFKLISNKTLKITYIANFIFLLFSAYLVNLDVSIIDSLLLGDFQLLFAFLVVMVPFFFFINKKAT